MKTALVTTTITVPHVLEQYRALDDSVSIIVAGDDIDPETERQIDAFCASINARYLSYAEQGSLDYAVHDVIGPRSIQRRVIAVLEALKGGCDVLISCDTDNAPVDDQYFETIRRLFSLESFVPSITGDQGWVDPGIFAVPSYAARGMPLPFRNTQNVTIGGVIDVVQSLVYGDPDTSALDRIMKAPNVERFSRIAESGFVIDPRDTWSVINTQSTAWRRPLAPFAAPWSGCGRFDDIVAGWVCQRIAADLNRRIYYGPPFVRQDRHEHNLVDDLEAELWGMRFGEQFCNDLKAMDLSAVRGELAKFWLIAQSIQSLPYLSDQAKAFALAYSHDLLEVM